MRYNGWNNRETWAVALWIDSDQGTYNTRRDWCDEAAREGWRTGDPVGIVADLLCGFVADMACASPRWGLFGDLGGRSASTLARVDHREIAAGWWEEWCDENPEQAEAV